MASDINYSSLNGTVVPVWVRAQDRLGPTLSESIPEVVSWIKEDGSNFNSLLRGATRKNPRDPIKRLSDSVIKHLGRDLKKIQEWLTILRQVIIVGNDMQVWNLKIPDASVCAPRQKGRFSPSRFKKRILIDDWKQALFDSFQKDMHLNEDQLIGQIMLSSAICGGLVNSQIMISFAQEISAPEKYFLNKRYFDIKPKWSGHDDVEYRRWFPDLLTETLLVRFRGKIPDLSNTKMSGPWIFKRIESFMKTFGVKRSAMPSGISEFLDVTRIQYELALPPFLADYGARKYLSHSVRESAWQRLPGHSYGIRKEIEQPLDLAKWDIYPKIEEELVEGECYLGSDLSDIRSALKKGKPDDVVRALNEYISTLSAETYRLEYMLASWFVFLMSRKNGEKPLKSTTLLSYLSTIGNRLDEILPEESFIETSKEEFEEAYCLLLDDLQSKGLRRKAARILNQFHRYMEDTYYIVGIDYQSVLGECSAPVPVDANVVWADEYIQIQKFLSNSNLVEIHPDMVDVAKLILTLGYRCGLRRMEALKLRIQDIVGSSEPELMVRPFLGRRLKTNSSKRRIPLKSLLTEDEIYDLIKWKDKRVIDEDKCSFSDYLFSIPEKNFICVPEDLVFPILHKSMRSVTGDESLRYHHLRHSFASLTLLKLMVSEYGMPEGFFEERTHQYSELKRSDELKKHLIIIAGPTRKFLYAVSSLLGHSGPDISLEHYIHILDILLYSQCKKSFEIPNSVICNASGEPAASVYRWLDKGEKVYLDKLRGRNSCSPTMVKSSVRNTIDSKLIETKTLDENAINQIGLDWQVLYLRSKFNVDIELLADRRKSTAAEVESLLDAARFIYREEVKGPKSGSRFPKMKNLSKNGCDKALNLPPRPRKKIDEVFSKELTVFLSRLRNNNYGKYEDFLNLHKSNTWKTRYHFVAKEFNDAELFLHCLDEIGINKRDIRLHYLHGQKAGRDWISRGKKVWKEKLNTGRSYEWKVNPVTDGKAMGEYGWLGINILNNPSREASAAFRYVMTMLLIRRVAEENTIGPL